MIQAPILTITKEFKVEFEKLSEQGVRYDTWVQTDSKENVCPLQSAPISLTGKKAWFHLSNLNRDMRIPLKPGKFSVSVIAKNDNKEESTPATLEFDLTEEQAKSFEFANVRAAQVRSAEELRNLKKQLDDATRSFDEYQKKPGNTASDKIELFKKLDEIAKLKGQVIDLDKQVKKSPTEENLKGVLDKIEKLDKEVSEKLADFQKKLAAKSKSKNGGDQQNTPPVPSDSERPASDPKPYKDKSKGKSQFAMLIMGIVGVLGILVFLALIGLIFFVMRDQNIAKATSDANTTKTSATQEIERARQIQVESMDQVNELKQQMEGLRRKQAAAPQPEPCQAQPSAPATTTITINNVVNVQAPEQTRETSHSVYRRRPMAERQSCQIIEAPGYWSPTLMTGVGPMLKTPYGYFYR